VAAVEKIMKSLIKLITHDADFQRVAWTPDELGVTQEPVLLEEKRDEILALFGQELIANPEEVEKRLPSNVHSVELGREFSSWLPNDMDWQPPFVGREAWAFIQTADGAVPVVFNEEPVQAENILEDQPQPEVVKFDPEEAAEAILRRARAQADEIILDAQLAADNCLLQAQDEIDQQKLAGHQQGLQEGIQEAQREMESALKATHSLVAEVHEWQKALMAQAEQILVEMAKEISQTLFGEGAKLDGNALQINLNRIMESAQGLGDLNIFLNPRDARLLDPSWSEYQLLITGDRVKVIPSENITIGGCFVKGSMGSVDGRVETQLAAVLKSFEENKEVNE
jgi:flagellar assembly protein FliH